MFEKSHSSMEGNDEGADAQAIKEALRLVFPTLPKSLNRIGEFAMASLVYHQEFLLENLPKSHPLLESVLFQNDIVYNKLKCLLQCKLSHKGRFKRNWPSSSCFNSFTNETDVRRIKKEH